MPNRRCCPGAAQPSFRTIGSECTEIFDRHAEWRQMRRRFALTESAGQELGRTPVPLVSVLPFFSSSSSFFRLFQPHRKQTRIAPQQMSTRRRNIRSVIDDRNVATSARSGAPLYQTSRSRGATFQSRCYSCGRSKGPCLRFGFHGERIQVFVQLCPSLIRRRYGHVDRTIEKPQILARDSPVEGDPKMQMAEE